MSQPPASPESTEIVHPLCSSKDRREAVRFPCRLRGLWWPVGVFTSGIWQGQVCDVSREGLALAVDGPEEPGTFLVLRPLRPEDDGRRTYRLLVVRAAQRDKQIWVLGCRFDRPLAPQDLVLFAPQVAAAPAP